MNEADCRTLIQGHLSSSPCGTVFKYSNVEYGTSIAHRKFVIAHDKYLSVLYVVSTTTKSLSLFKYSKGIGEDIIELDGSNYEDLTTQTFVECSKIEEIPVEKLVEKCVGGSPQNFETLDPLPEPLLQEIQSKAFESEHAAEKYKRQVGRCMPECRRKAPTIPTEN